MKLADINGWWYEEGKVSGTTVYERDEVQLSKVLGPDGEPYAIRRTKHPFGFDLTKRKKNDLV